MEKGITMLTAIRRKGSLPLEKTRRRRQGGRWQVELKTAAGEDKAEKARKLVERERTRIRTWSALDKKEAIGSGKMFYAVIKLWLEINLEQCKEWRRSWGWK